LYPFAKSFYSRKKALQGMSLRGCRKNNFPILLAFLPLIYVQQVKKPPAEAGGLIWAL